MVTVQINLRQIKKKNYYENFLSNPDTSYELLPTKGSLNWKYYCKLRS